MPKAEKYEVIDKNGNRRDYASSKEKAEACIERHTKERPEFGPFKYREADKYSEGGGEPENSSDGEG